MLESIRLLISFAVNRGITLYQMDVKSAFLNGYIEEEVYMHQPPGFEDTKHPEHVFKLKKSLYGVKRKDKSQAQPKTLSSSTSSISVQQKHAFAISRFPDF